MSLYAIVHGSNEFGPPLVGLLQLRQSMEVGRYRDAWVEAEGDVLLIRVHTRNGGGNREDYEYENGTMQDHPWYVRDADADYDCTYADFWFAPPLRELEPKTAELLVILAQPPVDVGARWRAAIEAIKGES